MKTLRYIMCVLAAVTVTTLTSCFDDLDQYPHIEQTPKDVYNSVQNYEGVLAKLYGSYVLAGQDKGGGNVDITGSSGFDYMRCYFNLQEAGTDEVIFTSYAADNQTGITFLQWDSNDTWVFDTYYRIYYTIALCNEFIRNASDDALSKFSDSEQATLKQMRNEARFLRALAYSHALDLFRDVPFVDENFPVGTDFPPKYTAQQIFDYITAELEDVATLLPAQPEYPRAGAAAAYGILGRVYLNAEAYGCGNHYDDCVRVCKAITGMGYDTLEPDFEKLFNADNHKRTGEILFAFAVDNEQSVSWGASTYIVCATTSTACATQQGLPTGAWNMVRCRSQIPALYDEYDKRRLFDPNITETKIPSIEAILGDESVGFRYTKWSNLNDEGQAQGDTNNGVSTDLPIIRLADVYLMLAECYLRGASNITQAEALAYVNKVRERAYGDSQHNITQASDLTLDFILDERARELSLEMVRRTDLVRFGCFTTDKYLWDFKGGQVDGVAVDDKYNVYPIPYAEQTANPNMKQDY